MNKDTSTYRNAVSSRLLAGDTVSDMELLTAFICYSTDLRSAYKLAHKLMGAYRHLDTVLYCSCETLMSMGASEQTALLLHTAGELSGYLTAEQGSRGILIRSSADAAEYLMGLCSSAPVERVIMLLLDGDMRLIHTETVSEGAVNSAVFHNRTLVEQALRHGAKYVILAHNHPDGDAYPSDADISATQSLSAALEMLDIRLIEHYVIANMKAFPIVLYSGVLAPRAPEGYYDASMLNEANRLRSAGWARGTQGLKKR